MAPCRPCMHDQIVLAWSCRTDEQPYAALMQAAAAVVIPSSAGQGPDVLPLLVCCLNLVRNAQLPQALAAESQHLHLLVRPLPNAAQALTLGCTSPAAQLKQQCTQTLTARLSHVYCLLWLTAHSCL